MSSKLTARADAKRTAPVTVIIPAYNSARFLEDSVGSALTQSLPPEKIIVVDDESPDNSFDVASRLAKTNPTITVIRRKNGGACAARNSGVRLSNSEYILFLDADDRLLPKAIEHHLSCFAENTAAVMVFGSNHVIAEDGSRIETNIVPHQDVLLEDLALTVTPCPSQCLYRREGILRVGGLDESLRPGDEIDLNMRLLDIGRIVSFPELVMEYRHHPSQGTRNIFSNSRAHLRVIEMNIGPQGRHHDPVLYRRSRRKWLARYGKGQHIAVLGAIRHGRFKDVLPATRLMVMGFLARLSGGS